MNFTAEWILNLASFGQKLKDLCQVIDFVPVGILDRSSLDFFHSSFMAQIHVFFFRFIKAKKKLEKYM